MEPESEQSAEEEKQFKRNRRLLGIFYGVIVLITVLIVFLDCTKVTRCQKAAEQGDVEAQYKLGMYYWYGDGVESDDAQAAEWYRKAAEQGHAEAQVRLGEFYYNGDFVEQDYAQAQYWWQKAADQGNEDAQRYLDEYF